MLGVFQAPEFFQRTESGQLRYHRSVDVYAAGLTFLAMLQRNRLLVPQIETPLEGNAFAFLQRGVLALYVQDWPVASFIDYTSNV